MPTHIALLRAVNVGGTGKLPMVELKAMCESCGFEQVKTYIASGNVVFLTKQSEAQVKKALEAKLEAYAGKPVGVMVRGEKELQKILADQPFPEAAPNRTTVTFLDKKPPANAAAEATNVKDEEIRTGRRELYIHYGSGMASSRLKVPAAQHGTARNINTVTKLVALLAALER